MALKAAIEAVRVALVADELAAAQTLAARASDHDLTHAIYEDWLAATAPGGGPELTLAMYLDIVRNVADLKGQISQWERGDVNSRNVALEKAERLERVRE